MTFIEKESVEEIVEINVEENVQMLPRLDHAHTDERLETYHVQSESRPVILLTETETIEMLSCTSALASIPDEVDKTLKQNAAYQALLEQRLTDHSVFFRRDREAQTFHNSQRDKSTIWCATQQVDVGVGSTCEDDTTTYKQQDNTSINQTVMSSRSLLNRLQWIENILHQEAHHELHLEYFGLPTLLDAEIIPDGDENESQQSSKEDSCEISKHDQDERSKQADNEDGDGEFVEENGSPRKAAPDSGEDTRSKTVLKLLCNAACSLTEGRPVTALDWGKEGADMIAVAYDPKPKESQSLNEKSETDKPKGGLILVWSFRNMYVPCKRIDCEERVSSLAFSTLSPNILAVGLMNGILALYNVSDPKSEPFSDSLFVHGRPILPIWALTWIHKQNVGRDSFRGDPTKTKHLRESLISVSSDGRILEWTVSASGLFLEGTWMTIRGDSTLNEQSLLGSTTGICLDFIPGTNQNMYLVGAENGSVLMCSSAHTENALKVYTRHTGAVLSVACSPFLPSVFLTSSMDYSIRLWSPTNQTGGIDNEAEPKLELRPPDLWDAVNAVVWSPLDATVFASVTEDGRLFLFDLTRSLVDPLECHLFGPSEDEALSAQSRNGRVTPALEKRPALKCMAFSPKEPVLVVGTASGDVLFFKYSQSRNREFILEDSYEVIARVKEQENRLRILLSQL